MITPIDTNIIQDTDFRANLMTSTLMNKSEDRKKLIREIIDTEIALNIKRLYRTLEDNIRTKLDNLKQKST